MGMDACIVGPFRRRLEEHPVYAAMRTPVDLRRFTVYP